MEKLAIVGKYPEEAYELLDKTLSKKFKILYITEQEELDKSTDLEYVVLRTLKINREIIMNNKNLKLIQRWGAGYDTIDMEEANKRNIPVAVATGINSCAVAEHTILLILALYRHLIPLNESIKNGIWDRTTFASKSFTITNKKLGLLGFGAIGKMVAQKSQVLGAEVQYYDIYRLGQEIESTLRVKYVDFKTLLQTSDIITIHLPLTSDTVDLISREELNLMKKNAIIVNTSRGGIINENDLADFLQSGNLLGAALDSFEKEPYPKDGRFSNINNIIMTPHIGGTVADLVEPMAMKVSDNVLRVYEKKSLSKADYVNYKYCSYPGN